MARLSYTLATINREVPIELDYEKNKVCDVNKEEFEAVDKVCNIIKNQNLIACTSCKYCVDGCIKNIPIPDIFACINQKKQYNDWNSNFYYSIATNNKGKASDCIMCGKCEKACPQFLPIRNFLKEAVEIFEKK